MCREDKNVFVSGRGSQFYIFSDGRLGSLGYVVFDYHGIQAAMKGRARTKAADEKLRT